MGITKIKFKGGNMPSTVQNLADLNTNLEEREPVLIFGDSCGYLLGIQGDSTDTNKQAPAILNAVIAYIDPTTTRIPGTFTPLTRGAVVGSSSNVSYGSDTYATVSTTTMPSKIKVVNNNTMNLLSNSPWFDDPNNSNAYPSEVDFINYDAPLTPNELHFSEFKEFIFDRNFISSTIQGFGVAYRDFSICSYASSNNEHLNITHFKFVIREGNLPVDFVLNIKEFPGDLEGCRVELYIENIGAGPCNLQLYFTDNSNNSYSALPMICAIEPDEMWYIDTVFTPTPNTTYLRLK